MVQNQKNTILNGKFGLFVSNNRNSYSYSQGRATKEID